MNQPAPPIEAEAFLASLRDRTARGVSAIALDGGELPVSVHLRESSSLVFTFTGAVNRDEGRALPQFGAMGLKNHVPASYIRLADPSLVRNDEMRLAWYAGHEGFELQKILPGLIGQMIESTGATRVAFLGGSGGGFAALYYSWHIPGSVAVVVNPQTNLNLYHWGHRRRYRQFCWPSLGNKAPLNDVIDSELGPIYASHRTNTVICMQIASDFFHLTHQFSPFVAALPVEYLDRLIVRVANWGVQGHRPPPPSIWVPWLAAALSAPETTATSIEETWADQNPRELTEQSPPTFEANRGAPFVPANGKSGTNERLNQLSPVDSAAGHRRDERIAAAIARTAISSLLSDPPSDRSQL